MKSFEYKEENKCSKVLFLNEGTGEYKYSRCGRRSCPRCASAYAHKVGNAIEGVHPAGCTHLVLTVSDFWIKEFPTEKDYWLSKQWTKDNARYRMATKLSEMGAGDFNSNLKVSDVLQARSKIEKSSRRASKAIRGFLRILGNSMGVNHQDIGYIRSTEFGEKNGRFHVHVVIMRDFLVVMDVLNNICPLSYDPERDIHFGNFPFWKYGMIRVVGLSSSTSAIKYLSAYSTKNSPGRVTKDRRSSTRQREMKEVISVIVKNGLKDKISYAAQGAAARSKEASKDRKYESLLSKEREKRKRKYGR